MAAIARHVELALAWRPGDATDRPHPHGVHHHNGDLVRNGPAVGVVHERVAGPRGGSHSLEAAQAATGAGVHAGQFVLALHIIAIHLRQTLGHILSNVGGWRNWVAGEHAAPGRNSALGERKGASFEDATPLNVALRPLCPGGHERVRDGSRSHGYRSSPATASAEGAQLNVPPSPPAAA